MGFEETFERLRKHHKAILDEPCDNPKDQETHDRLARFDRLYDEGHTKMCACQQVYGEEPCTCGKEEKA